jgi:hypothetical protein
MINRNPAALLEKRDRPKIERKSVTTIDAPTTATVMDTAREGGFSFSWCSLRPAAGRDNRAAPEGDRSRRRPTRRDRQHGTA